MTLINTNLMPPCDLKVPLACLSSRATVLQCTLLVNVLNNYITEDYNNKKNPKQAKSLPAVRGHHPVVRAATTKDLSTHTTVMLEIEKDCDPSALIFTT